MNVREPLSEARESSGNRWRRERRLVRRCEETGEGLTVTH